MFVSRVVARVWNGPMFSAPDMEHARVFHSVAIATPASITQRHSVQFSVQGGARRVRRDRSPWLTPHLPNRSL
ncbi:hypothetical protein J6590_082526 [Homalodisca vitripennis]|nr:hypothetical protein J6590_082526 [Homalodisca vitripennis]